MNNLTEKEKAYIQTANLELDLFFLIGAARALIKSKRKLTKNQMAVLTLSLDELEERCIAAELSLKKRREQTKYEIVSES